MSAETSLIVAGALPAIAVDISAEAIAKKSELVAEAQSITEVADAFDCERAVAAANAIREHRKALEAARKEAKSPALDLGKRIDAVAQAHEAPLIAEEDRLRRMTGPYLAAEQRKREEAERAARAAAEKARREAEEATRKRIEAERKAAAGTPDTLAADVRAINAKAEAEVAAAKAAIPASEKPAGTRVQRRLIPTVVDVATLAQFNPQLTKVVVDDDALRNALKDELFAQSALDGKVPGLSVREEIKAI